MAILRSALRCLSKSEWFGFFLKAGGLDVLCCPQVTCLATLQRLWRLELPSSTLSSSALLAECASLRCLVLEVAQGAELSMAPLSTLRHLTSLALEFQCLPNANDGAGRVDGLAELRSLCELDLRGVPDEPPAGLSELTALRGLSCVAFRRGDCSFAFAEGMAELESLVLIGSTYFRSLTPLPNWAKLTALRHLSLTGCFQTHLPPVPTRLTSLELRLKLVSKFTLAGAVLPELRKLVLACCMTALPRCLASWAPGLEALELGSNTLLSQSTGLFAGMRQLQELRTSHSNISGRAGFESLKGLRTLILKGRGQPVVPPRPELPATAGDAGAAQLLRTGRAPGPRRADGAAGTWG